MRRYDMPTSGRREFIAQISNRRGRVCSSTDWDTGVICISRRWVDGHHLLWQSALVAALGCSMHGVRLTIRYRASRPSAVFEGVSGLRPPEPSDPRTLQTQSAEPLIRTPFSSHRLQI